jgi:hypothetical protein
MLALLPVIAEEMVVLVEPEVLPLREAPENPPEN